MPRYILYHQYEILWLYGKQRNNKNRHTKTKENLSIVGTEPSHAETKVVHANKKSYWSLWGHIIASQGARLKDGLTLASHKQVVTLPLRQAVWLFL